MFNMADENQNEMKPFNWEFIQSRGIPSSTSYYHGRASVEWIRAMDREIEKSSKDEF